MPATAYDTIGRGYASRRRTDPRIAARLWAALGDARSVVNVGAGSGSYEPPDRWVVAVEPSAVMLAQKLMLETSEQEFIRIAAQGPGTIGPWRRLDGLREAPNPPTAI